MNRSKIVIYISAIAIILFAGASYFWQQQNQQTSVEVASNNPALERSYSPSFGPEDAKVTIVEFFDPACEACRAFYPVVKKIMSQYPNDVRLVLRYTTFHKGSDEVVRIIEAAREQNLFKAVLEKILIKQPEWASHGTPDLAKAWEAAQSVGLDIEQAKIDGYKAVIDQRLQQEFADVKTMNVEKTPAFFVNGKGLPSFGAQQLYDLVTSEVNRLK